VAQAPFLECRVYGSSTVVSRDAKYAFGLHIDMLIYNQCISLATYSFTESRASGSSTNDDGDADYPSVTLRN
jgi:hypothetical protein